MEARTITVIPKKSTEKFDAATGIKLKKKVCAYARVSTDMEDQKNSFNVQCSYYKNYIESKSDWEFVKLYSDEGISGTSIKRPGFMEMMKDAKEGKIELILTKSISRFARNTVDCIKAVRELRSINVFIYFEKENINTEDPKIEMILTIFASMAQEESNSISQQVKWGVRKRMAKGERKVQTRTLLGFDSDEEGNLVINKEEAKAVKMIFDLFAAGCSYREICDQMESMCIKTGTGRDKWQVGDIHRILTNEKYCGDLLLQKTVVVDFLTHKAVKNEGIVEQYYIENHHEGFIKKELFNYVQELRKITSSQRPEKTRRDRRLLSGMVICSSCLRPMTVINQHPGKPYAREVLTCKTRNTNSLNYHECPVKSCLDYGMAATAAREVFGRFFIIDESKIQEFARQAGQEAMMASFCSSTENLRKEIDELEERIREIVKAQISSRIKEAYKSEFDSVKEMIRAKQEELARITIGEKERIEANRLTMEVLEYSRNNDSLPHSLLKRMIKICIRKNDGSLRFVISDEDIEPTRENIDSLLAKESVHEGQVMTSRGTLRYDVVKG